MLPPRVRAAARRAPFELAVEPHPTGYWCSFEKARRPEPKTRGDGRFHTLGHLFAAALRANLKGCRSFASFRTSSRPLVISWPRSPAR